MKRLSILGFLGLLLACSATVSAQKLDFSGSWTMDRARSFGMPGNMNQTMSVAQSGDEIQVDTKLIQPGNERTQKDTYVLDGKERDFTPPVPPNAPANAPPPKGKRTAYWMPGNKGILVEDVVTTETPNGPSVTKTTRKWTFSSGELVIDMYVDNPNISYEAKRVFKKNGFIGSLIWPASSSFFRSAFIDYTSDATTNIYQPGPIIPKSDNIRPKDPTPQVSNFMVFKLITD